MLRWLLLRCLWMVPTLLGITLVTFFVLDLAPVDRATMELAQRKEQASVVDANAHEYSLARLRIRYGLVDERTLQPVPVLLRYGRWLWNAVNLRFCGDGEDPVAFRRRIAEALPVSLLIGFWALVAALAIGAPLGSWLGMRTGSAADRTATAVMFALFGLPEVLVATLLVLLFCGPVFDWFPSVGLHSDRLGPQSVLAQLFDLAWHLVLPVAVMAIAPALLITRFLRESVGRVATSTFALNLEAWGVDAHTRRRRLLRAGFAPVATLIGSLLPQLIAGSIVVETVFSIEGAGRLAWNAVRNQDQAMVMFVVLLASIATLLSLLLSDVAHRWIDPRVRLAA